jgi:hypothetical protein
MTRTIALLLNLALASALGCASVAGIDDLKKEGEGGKGLDAECSAVTECGAGLTCAGGNCLRKCFDLASPRKTCGANTCVPLLSLTEAVCFEGGDSEFGACTKLSECAPGFNCVEFVAGKGGRCAPYCHEGGSECDSIGGDCRGFTNKIVINGVQWGVCAPSSLSGGSTGGGD